MLYLNTIQQTLSILRFIFSRILTMLAITITAMHWGTFHLSSWYVQITAAPLLAVLYSPNSNTRVENGKVVMLTIISSLVAMIAMEAVMMMTTSGTVSGEKGVNLTFPFKCKRIQYEHTY